MLLSDLSPETLARIKSWRFDRISRKARGPGILTDLFEWADLESDGPRRAPIRAPTGLRRTSIPNITVLRSYASPDGESITLFLKDTSLARYYSPDPGAVLGQGSWPSADRVEPDLYVAVVFHEWFIVENA